MTTVRMADTFTSTGHKFFAHQEAMQNLRNGKGQPIVTHVMLTDVCNHTCAFCSVQARAGDSLLFDDVMQYLDILRSYGLKAVILSGGGNPILYKCKKTGKDFNDVVDAIYGHGLEIGLITNGMPLVWQRTDTEVEGMRQSWKTVKPDTLDKLTWIRISMAGLDHDECEVYVPDIDPAKTTLGFSYVAHDIYNEPADPHHGKVSTERDLITVDRSKCKQTWRFEDRILELTDEIEKYATKYNPKYVRLLPDCLDVPLIEERSKKLRSMASVINTIIGREVVFCQYKPPAPPSACYLGYIHPVLNCDGYVYPCDSVVLAAAEIGYQEGKPNHKFDDPWRVCHWSEIEKLYTDPVHSLIKEPRKQCQGCVFTRSNEILSDVVHGKSVGMIPVGPVEHVNFV